MASQDEGSKEKRHRPPSTEGFLNNLYWRLMCSQGRKAHITQHPELPWKSSPSDYLNPQGPLLSAVLFLSLSPAVPLPEGQLSKPVTPSPTSNPNFTPLPPSLCRAIYRACCPLVQGVLHA